MAKILLCAAVSAISLVTEVQAPHHYTAYDFASDLVAQCVEDLECGTDTDCVETEDACIREMGLSVVRGGL